MSAPTRLAAFAAVLALTFGGAAFAGAAIDPTDEAELDQHLSEEGGHGAEGGPALSGLAVSEGGYGLEVERQYLVAGQTAPFRFRITDERGRAVRTEFQIEHEKELHLIVVRRDTAGFAHLHPAKDPDGTWSIDLTLPSPGTYRAYTDFKIGGQKRTLATDLFAPGDFQPVPLPAPVDRASALDSAGSAAGDIDVTLEAPALRSGRETSLTFAVTQQGVPFEGLEPYLGANGHLVALREGDLAYLHVHPTEAGAAHGGKGPSAAVEASSVAFAATFPTPGRYRLFLQLKTGGDIRTASYTLEVPR
jgi:hypothetical protein